MNRADYSRRSRRESTRKRIGKRLARVVAERDHRRCVYCDGPGDTLDHLKPRSRGGTDCPTNLVTACLRCNSARQSMPLSTWARYAAVVYKLDFQPRKLRRHAAKIIG